MTGIEILVGVALTLSIASSIVALGALYRVKILAKLTANFSNEVVKKFESIRLNSFNGGKS